VSDKALIIKTTLLFKKAADAKEIDSRNVGCQCSGIKKRTIKFQNSWMKDRPWLFHDEETDR
jgi:hypothetical protein